MTLPDLSQLIFVKSHGLISLEESRNFLVSVYQDGRTTGYDNGYRQCSLDRKRLKKMCALINMDLVNEFMDKCIEQDIFEIKQLIKHPDLLKQYKDLFNADIIF